jgi:hypothetical protein
MGLDMNLYGVKYPERPRFHTKPQKRGGAILHKEVYDLAYWRKHPDLHGWIVKEFANGIDECQDIHLSETALEQIIKAVKDDDLAHGTEGFFFGRSYQPGEADAYYSYKEQKREDLKQLRHALRWLKKQSEKYFNYVYYKASW